MTQLLQRLQTTLREFTESAQAYFRARTEAESVQMVVEELEPRILHSADFSPAVVNGDALTTLVENRELEAEPAPVESTPGGQSEQVRTLELVFIDTATPDYQMMLDDIAAGSGGEGLQVVLLDSESNGIEQITKTLAAHTDVGAVHIISHGSDGVVKLGQGALDASSIEKSSNEIAGWSSALTQDADLLIYGCDVAQTDAGRDLMQRLGNLTGADVAASDDLTGATALGGDWELEFSTGAIETDIALSQYLQQNWGHALNITLDATTTDTTPSFAANDTVSHTTAGTERLMLVGISFGQDHGDSVTSVTYNGTALNLVGAIDNADNASSRVEIWELIAPDTGAHNVVVNYSGTNHEGATIGVMTFNGVDQATPLGSFASDEGDSTILATTVASGAGEIVFGVGAFDSINDENLTPGGGQFSNWDLFVDKANGAGSLELGSTFTTTSWTVPGSGKWAVAGVSVKPSTATSLIVDTTNDVVDGTTTSIAALLADKGADGFISLREAVLAANATIGDDTIILSSGTYSLTLTGAGEDAAATGDLDITDNVDIMGDGANSTIIDGANSDRVFHQIGSSLRIAGATVANGNAGSGGGIEVDAASNLLLRDTAVSFNQATLGAGIMIHGSAIFENVTFEGNATTTGGGIYVETGASATLENVTMSANTASDGGAIATKGTATITNSTIAANVATTAGGISMISGGTASLQNTILANNTGNNASGPVTSLGYNIDSGNTAALGGIGDLTNTDPLLGPLQYNGGTTKTMALSAGSPAINAGNDAAAPTTDQRGGFRNATSDIGAFEFNSVSGSNIVAVSDAYTVNEDTQLDSTADWYDTNWLYRRTLAFDNSGQSENLVDVPVLVTLDSTRIDYSNTQNNGEDLRFVDGNGTLLAHQIESWNESGTSTVWVKVPQINAGSSTDFIHMYYGNAAAVDGQNATAVWDASYKGIWHLNETSGNHSDATSNNYALSPFNSPSQGVTGKIGGADDFDGTDDHLKGSGPDAHLQITGDVTLEAWVNIDSYPGAGQFTSIVEFAGSGDTEPENYLYSMLLRPGGDINLGHESGAGVDDFYDMGVSLNTGQWYQLTAVRDTTAKTWSLYIDGTLAATQSYVSNATGGTGAEIWVGYDTEYLDGTVDEIRISDSARSADWIKAQYASTADSLVTYGFEQVAPAAGVLSNDFDTDGDTLTAALVTGPSNAASFSLNSDGSFTYDPVANFNGVDSFTYRANDGSINSNLATVFITVTPIDDAPVLDNSGSPALTAINENEFNNTGDLVSAIIASAGGDPITDADAGAVEGIAIVSVDDSNGTWQYSINGGGAWTSFGAVSDSAAVVLGDSANDRIRFVPNTNYNGSALIAYRAWDMTDANPSGTTGVDVSTNGGATPFSAASETASIAITPVQMVLHVATIGDVITSGVPGLDAWSSSEMLALGDPNISFEPGTSNGTLSSLEDLDVYASISVDIDSMHVVSANITVGGGGNTIDLEKDDILFSIAQNSVTFTGLDLVPVATTKDDVIRFRPGDKSFELVLDNVANPAVGGVSLVEQATTVGDTVLAQGSFLLNSVNSNDIHYLVPTGAGQGVAAGTPVLLIDGDQIGLGGGAVDIGGIDLVEDDISPGNATLTAGQILITLDGDDAAVGSNNLSVLKNDIFYLTMTATTLGSGTAAGTATLLVEGADINLDTTNEIVTALSLDAEFGIQSIDPTIGLPGGPVNYTENNPPTVIDGAASLIDPDSTDLDGGQLRVDLIVGGTIDDRLAIRHQGSGIGQVGVSGNTISYEGTNIGTFTGGGDGSSPLVVTFNASSDVQAVQAVMRNTTYENVSNNPSVLPRTVRFEITDGDGGTSNVETETINVAPMNDIPTLTTFTAVVDTTNEDMEVELTFAELNAQGDEADPDGTVDGYVVQAVTTGSLRIGTSAGTANPYAAGTNDTIDAANNAYWTPATNDIGATLNAFTVVAMDNNGAVSVGPVQAQVQVNAVNDPPTVDLDTATGGVDYAFTFSEGDGLTTIVDASVTVADVDDTTLANVTLDTGGVVDGASEQLTIGSLNFALDAADFTDTTVNIGGSLYTVNWVNATGIATVTLNSGVMSIAQSEAVMLATQYQHTDTNTPTAGNRTIDVRVNDGNIDSAVARSTITVAAVNDAPTLSSPPAIGVTEDVASALTGITFNDIDAGGASVVATFTVAQGALSAAPSGGVTVGGTPTVLTLTGSVANINAFIAGSNLTYTTALNDLSAVTLGISVNDQGNTGTGGAQSSGVTNVTLNVSAVNDAPVNSVPGPQVTSEDTPLVFSTGNGNLISISDTDLGSNQIQITLTATNGTVTLNRLPGSESLGNTETTNDQKEPRIAIDGAGNYVVVWESEGQDGSKAGVYAQRYSADGAKQGVEFRVNSTTTGDQKDPAVAMDASGKFVVVWESADSNGTGIFAQRFKADGSKDGVEFQVNTATSGDQKHAAVDMASDGKFVVAWEGPDANNKGVFAQRFNVGGAKEGVEFQANTTTAGEQKRAAVAIDADGDWDFVIAWESPDVDKQGIFAQRFSKTAGSGEFTVNAVTAGEQRNAAIAMDVDGDFVVAWESDAAGSKDIVAQRFNSSNVKQGVEIAVNTITAGDQKHSSVAMNADGDFVVAWQGPDANMDGVYAQQFNAAGDKQGNEILVNTTVADDQRKAAVVMDTDGDFAIAWESSSGGFKDVYQARSIDLSFSAGNGISDVSMTFTGTLADINKALDGLTFDPTPNYNGPADIQIIVNDLGSSGSGGAKTDTDTVNITVGSANDAPTVDLDTGTGGTDYAFTFTEGDGLTTIVDASVAVADIDDTTLVNVTFDTGGVVDGASERLAIGSLNFALDAADFTDTTVNIGGSLYTVNWVNATGIATVTLNSGVMSIAQSEGVMLATQYQHTDTGNPTTGNRTIDIRVNDGNTDSAVATSTITVTTVNDAPGLSAPGAMGVNEDAASALTGISFSDVDAGGASVVATFTVAQGTLAATSGGGVTVGGTPTALVLTGSTANINTFIAASNLTYTTALNDLSAVTLGVSVNDQGNTGSGGALSSGVTNVTLNVIPVNDAPSLSAPPAIGVTEDVATALTGISFSDIDAGGGSVVATFTVAQGTLAATPSGGVTVGGTPTALTLTGSTANINAFVAASNLTYTTAQNDTSAVTLGVSVNDQGNTGIGGAQSSGVTNVTLNVSPVNDAPTVDLDTGAGGVGYAVTFTEGDAPTAIVDASVAVADVDDTTLMNVTLDTAGIVDGGSEQLTIGSLNFALDAADFTDTSVNIGGNTYTVNWVNATGIATVTLNSGAMSIAQSEVVMLGTQYQHTDAGNPTAGNRTIDVRVNDGNTDSAVATSTITVAAVNDAPGLSAPGAIGVTEDVATALTGISFSDIDAGGASVVATFTVAQGTLTATPSGGVTLGGTPTALTLTGSVANINAFIAASNLTYTTALNDLSAVTLGVSVNDQGNTGIGGAQSSGVTNVTLNVTAVNDAPSLSAPGAIGVTEDVATALTGISFSDVDAGGTNVVATFTVAQGALTATPSGGVAVGGTPTALTLTGSVANINAFIAASNLTYTTALNDTSTVTLGVSANDQGNTGSGGALSSGVTNITLNVNGVNDAPINSVPGAQNTALNTAVFFSTGNVNAISVSDIDAGGATIRMTLSTPDGTLTLNGTAGLTFLSGTVNGDPTIIFTGTIANINTALDGLRFDPTPAFTGSTIIAVTTDDLGGSGLGGPLTDNDNVIVNVSFTNTAPVLTGANDLTAINEDAATNPGTSVLALIAGQISDANAGALSGIAVTAVDNTNGNWEYSTNGGASWMAFGNPTDATARLLAENGNTFVRFVPNADWNGTVANGLTFRAWDQTSGAAGGVADTTTNAGTTAFSTATASASVAVNAVNDAPGQTMPGTIGVSEDVASALTGISFSDVDAGAANVVATFTVPQGTLAATSGGGVTVGGTSTALTLTGSAANINAFIAASNLTYTTALNDTSAITLGVSVNDQGNTGSGGALSSGVNNVTLNVAPANDAPTGTVNITGTLTEDQVLTASNSLADADGLGAISYQWQRNNVNIAGATGNTFTLGDIDVGTTIRVIASYIDGQGTPESVASAGVGPVANINDTPVGIPTITGTVTEDQTLTANTTGISDADGLGAFNYQWLRNSVAIAGATAGTYTLGDADVGTRISVNVSYTDGHGTAEGPLASVQTAAVTGINDAPVINALPPAQTVIEGNVLAFSAANGNAIAISDVDAGAANVELSLTATDGTLTLANLSGLGFGIGDGIDDATMRFTGSVTAVNNALNGLSFTSSAGFTGNATVSARIDDLGNSGAGGPLFQAAAVNVNVVAATPPPIVPGPPPAPPVAPPPEPPVEPPTTEPDPPAPEETGAPAPAIVAPVVIAPAGDATPLVNLLDDDDSARETTPLRDVNAPDSQANRQNRIIAVGGGFDVGYFGLGGTDLASGNLNFIATPTTAFPTFDAGHRALHAPEFVDELDRMRDILEQQAQTKGIIVTSGTAATVGLSVGYLFWLLRAEVLLGSLLSSMPAWRMVDPLPVLGRLTQDEDDENSDDDDSLESLVERENRMANEEAVEDIEAI